MVSQDGLYCWRHTAAEVQSLLEEEGLREVEARAVATLPDIIGSPNLDFVISTAGGRNAGADHCSLGREGLDVAAGTGRLILDAKCQSALACSRANGLPAGRVQSLRAPGQSRLSLCLSGRRDDTGLDRRLGRVPFQDAWDASVGGWTSPIPAHGGVLAGGFVVLEGYAPAHFAVTAAFMSIIGVPWLMRGDTPLRKADDGRTPVKQALLSWIVRHAAKLLPGGTRQAANFAAAGAEEESIRIAGMTVDETKFCVRRRVQAQEMARLSLISVGRLIPRKRMSTVLEVVEGCRRLGLDVTAEIIGDGPERDRLAGNPLVREGVVAVRGRLAQREIAEALCKADVFILLSEDEPWGLVVNEAQAAGLPVIVAEGVGCAPGSRT